MRKIKKMLKEQVVVETVDILCNLCGKSCSSSKHSSVKEYNGLIEAEVWGGYSSTHIGDMTGIRFSLCEKCLWNLTKKFKIPYEIKNEYSTDFISLKKSKSLYKEAIKRSKRENKLQNKIQESLEQTRKEGADAPDILEKFKKQQKKI